MLSLLFLFLLFRGSSTAVVPIFDRAESATASTDAGLHARTTFGIVWGCLSTTFICAWVSVHPNIPPPKHEEYGWRSLARRMWLMFWTLVAPELILLWSFKQWKAAGKIARIYNGRDNNGEAAVPKSSLLKSCGDWFRGRLDAKELKNTAWTRTHGHFVAMGGIILLHPGDAQDAKDADESAQPDDRKPMETIVDIDMLKELVKDPDFKIDITEEEINDKAKGDFLSKTIAFLQVSWFITQCIARFVQKLGVTELEVVTLALASLNGLTYLFWSSKPLGLQVPVRMRYGRRVIVESKGTETGRLLRGLLPDLDLFSDSDALTSICIVFLCIILLPVLIPLAVVYIFVLLIAALGDVMLTDAIPPDATHVPAFYSPKTDSGTTISFALILPISGSAFGALHCLAWNFTYPTRAERTIWRAASLTIALTPISVMILILVLALFGKSGEGRRGRWMILDKLCRFMEWILIATMVLPTGVYVLARLVLLVEAFALLRRQPANAFQTVDWTKFLPHV